MRKKVDFPKLLKLYREARRKVFEYFEADPKKARRELRDHERRNPHEQLSLRV